MNNYDTVQLWEKIQRLEKRIEKLEGSGWQMPKKIFDEPNKTGKSWCVVCGIDMSKPIGYVCQNPNCPSRITCE